jgi:uncharacterized protein YjiS (DUF1127 family)
MTMILTGQAAGTHAARRAMSACRRLGGFVAAQFAAARTRRMLGDLDNRILDDIGLERTDIGQVAERVAAGRIRRSR